VRGDSERRVRIAPADRSALLAAAGGLAPKLAELRERALDLARVNVPALDFAGRTAHVAAVQDVVCAAHAAGYRLCDEDYRVTGEGPQQVRDYLIGLKENGADRGHEDAEALGRVIAMLDPS
jgi:hypothetical protein